MAIFIVIPKQSRLFWISGKYSHNISAGWAIEDLLCRSQRGQRGQSLSYSIRAGTRRTDGSEKSSVSDVTITEKRNAVPWLPHLPGDGLLRGRQEFHPRPAL